MTERIIEIAETSAFLSLENHLLKIRLAEGKLVTVPGLFLSNIAPFSNSTSPNRKALP